MNFFESKHCKSRMHCRRCRDVNSGKSWRVSIAAKFRMESPEFPCCIGLPWNVDRAAIPQHKTDMDQLVEAVARLDDEKPQFKWLKHMAAQCQELYKRKFPSCRQRKKHCEHQVSKLRYYWNEAMSSTTQGATA